MVEPTPAAGSLTRLCVKCRTQEATLESRSQPVCKDCFLKFVAGKFIKQIGILGKDVRPPPPPPSIDSKGPHTGIRRYLLGLSIGLSSTVLLHLLNENVDFILAKGRGAPFELVVVHVDTSASSNAGSAAAAETTDHDILAQYRERYPRFEFHCVPLSTLESPSSPSDRSSTTVPTAAATSRASASDITTHLTRRTLLAQTHAHNCQALLLGHSTTALAALTLAEAAKGRGFAVPWLVADGPVPGGSGSGNGNQSGNGDGDKPGKPNAPILIHHPLRDALRKELLLYARLVNPPLTALLPPSDPDSLSLGSTAAGEKDSVAATVAKPRPAVISHRDLSIEDVMTRYFAEVEENYPSVVANVARTTGKLVRGVGVGAEEGSKEGEEEEEECGLCGMPLDGDGDERWRGELGIQERAEAVSARWGRLCYGCERSTAG